MFEMFDKFEDAHHRYKEITAHVRQHRYKYVFGAGVVVGALGVHVLAGTKVVIHTPAPIVGVVHA